MIKIKRLIVGQMKSNCYLLYNENSRETLIIDPGDDADYITRIIHDLELVPTKIISSHGHFDHIMASYELQQAYDIPFLIHNEDEFLLQRMKETADYFLHHKNCPPPPKVDDYLDSGNELIIANCELQILHTPGHTPGSITLYSDNENFAFVGDLIFEKGGVGRTDFSYSRQDDLVNSIQNISMLPGGTMIYPGHGESFELCSFNTKVSPRN